MTSGLSDLREQIIANLAYIYPSYPKTDMDVIISSPPQVERSLFNEVDTFKAVAYGKSDNGKVPLVIGGLAVTPEQACRRLLVETAGFIVEVRLDGMFEGRASGSAYREEGLGEE